MKINLPAQQLKPFYAGLENLADAVKQGEGDISDEKLIAILQYISLKTNEETIKQTKGCIRIFKDILNDTDVDKQKSVGRLTSVGIPLIFAKPVVDILMGVEPPLSTEEENIYYATNAGEFLLSLTIDDLFKARDLLRRFEKGSSLSSEELEFLLKNDLLDEKQW